LLQVSSFVFYDPWFIPYPVSDSTERDRVVLCSDVTCVDLLTFFMVMLTAELHVQNKNLFSVSLRNILFFYTFISYSGNPDYGTRSGKVVHKWLLGGMSCCRLLLYSSFILSLNVIVMGFVEKLYFHNMCLCCKLLIVLCS
jgi:hypothetical protein